MEYCAKVESMKYLFKYSFKGHDLVTVESEIQMNEIERFQNKRHVSCCEAHWRIVGYQMVKLKPSVLQLPVHLESLNTIVYNNNVPAAQRALDNNVVTALTEHYATNAEHEGNLDILHENVHFF